MWGDVLCRGQGGHKSPSGVQGRSPGRESGGRSPPEAEAILDFYMHNFDLSKGKIQRKCQNLGDIIHWRPPLQILGDVSPRPPGFTPLLLCGSKKHRKDVIQ